MPHLKVLERDEHYIELRKARRAKARKRRANGVLVVQVEVTEKMRDRLVAKGRLRLDQMHNKALIAAAICRFIDGKQARP